MRILSAPIIHYKTNMTTTSKLSALLFLSVCLLLSCKEKKKAPAPEATTPFIIKKDSTPAPPQGAVRPPIVNIVDTFALKFTVLYMKDSAASSDRISKKLETIFGTTLPAFIKKQGLKTTGAPIAWYKSNKAPFYFEAGLPVNKKPGKLPKGIYTKNIGGEKALVAHFYGPYSLTYMGYDALSDFIHSNKKKGGTPYEMYITPPMGNDGKPIDPYKVQTDIVYPYQ